LTADPSPNPSSPRAPEIVEEFIPYSGRGRYARMFARLRPNLSLWIGLGLLGLFLAVSLAALVHYGSYRNLPPVTYAWVAPINLPPGPSYAHPFGTDEGLGIDVLSGILRATPTDVALVGGILLLSAGIGLLVGCWAGLAGGIVDLVAIGGSDLFVGVPPFFLVLILYLGTLQLVPPEDGLYLFAGLFVLVLWPYYARPVRAVAQRAAASPYVEASRAAGAGQDQLLVRHVLPNSMFPVLAQMPVDVYNIFFVLSVFPFLGCFGGGSSGLFAPISITPYPLFPEWGSLVAYGACYGWSILPELDAWWSYFFPMVTIVAFGLMVMLLCDGLERHMAPSSSR
jgi:peptide/nickel transport system permease protein